MVRIQDDLFEAVNADWLATTEIPSDRPRIAAFDELVIANEETLMKDFNAGDFDTQGDEVLAHFAKFYRKVADSQARSQFGTRPVQNEIERIESLRNFDDFKSRLLELTLDSQAPLPFSFEVAADMKDALHHTLYFSGASLILPDPAYYADEDKKTDLLDFYSQNTLAILKAFGYEPTQAQSLVDATLAFDARLIPLVNTSEERAKYVDLYRPVAFDQFVAQVKQVDLSSYLTDLLGTRPKEVILYEKRYFEHLDDLLDPAHFEELKAWMLVKLIRSSTHLLSEDLRVLGTAFSRKISGVEAPRPVDKYAFDLATGQFSQAVGLYYGRKYFGEAAKQDVLRMISEMVAVYKDRLANNSWLSAETKDKAIVKLNALTPMVGFPDQLPEIYQELVTGDGSIYEDVSLYNKVRTKRHYAKYVEVVDKTEWHMPAHMVNAYFSPDSNSIVFPAAILQAPFYSLDQSSSQNYGGIGAVIAHEISHAFDNNGARFDEFGNLKDWWQAADFEAFKAKQDLMIAQFEGLEIEAGKANGKLIVSENIADQGGIAAALEAAKKEADYDAKAFFTQWATIWRIKAQAAYQQMLLTTDVHAPGKLRANVQVSNLDDFFETFEVEESDKMWRAPQDRLRIW